MARYIKIAYGPTGSMDPTVTMLGNEYANGQLNLRSRYVQCVLEAHIGRDDTLEAVAPADLSDSDLAAIVAGLESEAEAERHNTQVELEHDREAARLEHAQNLRDLPKIQEVITTLKALADHPRVKDALAELEQAEVDLLKPPAKPTARRADPALNMALGACRTEAKRRGAARGEELDRLRTQLGALGVQV